MKSKAIMNTITRTAHKAAFTMKKKSPELFLAVGVVGVVTSTVMACKATPKAIQIKEEAKANLDTINECSEDKSLSEKYTDEDKRKDVTIVYAQTGLALVKTYAPAVLVGAASLGCIIASHNILKSRNVALASAYAALDKGYKEYRGRVKERLGDEVEREIFHNIKAKTITETEVDENGVETTVEETVLDKDATGLSPYAKCFDEGCREWTKSPEFNLIFLNAQQQYANDLLRSRGYLFLNDVYAALGFPKTKVGQVVGWLYDPDRPNGDNYVDFGIYNKYREPNRDFVNGYERSIWLDFNVDGYILDDERAFR